MPLSSPSAISSLRAKDTEISLVPLMIVEICLGVAPVRIASSDCFIPRFVISESKRSPGFITLFVSAITDHYPFRKIQPKNRYPSGNTSLAIYYTFWDNIKSSRQLHFLHYAQFRFEINCAHYTNQTTNQP